MKKKTLEGRLAGTVARLLVAGLLLLPPALVAQAEQQPLGAQSLRPYWHVFIAYALAWILVFGWLVSVARRLARVERRLEE